MGRARRPSEPGLRAREGAEVGLASLEIDVAPGRYGEPAGEIGRSADGAEQFPLRLPPELRRISILGTRGTDGAPRSLIESSSVDRALLDFAPYLPGVEVEVTLRNLEFRGGWAGAGFFAGDGQKVSISVAACVFSGAVGDGVEIYVGDGGTLSLDVRDSWFRGSSAGVIRGDGPERHPGPHRHRLDPRIVALLRAGRTARRRRGGPP